MTIVMKTRFAIITMLLLWFGTAVPASADETLTIPVLYLLQPVERPPVLSNIQMPYPDAGLKGAELGAADNNTTGRFLNHSYDLRAVTVENAAQAVEESRQWLDSGNSLIVTHLPAVSLRTLMHNPSIAGKAMVFNISATDDELRVSQCSTGLLHTIPSRAMLADALAQFLVARKWKEWLLVKGQRPEDEAYAAALNRSAKRFGGKIVAERSWTFDTDLRRTAQQELPLFTQFDDYDVTLVADELGDVGEYVPYNTWLPRPVAGTQGLTPVAWHQVVEQWGAIQLQNRFRSHAGRPMNDVDYAGWIALRAIAEAVTRTGHKDAAALYAYLYSETYELAGFKGRKMTFRPWNGQLRQPIPLVQPRSLVSQSPQPGFLHQHSELDTLGFDRPEAKCNYEVTL